MNQSLITTIVTAAAVILALAANNAYRTWKTRREQAQLKAREAQEALQKSLLDLRESLLPLANLSKSVDQIASLPGYMEGLVKVCEEMVKQVVAMQGTIAKFAFLVTGDNRDPKKVLQMTTESDQYRTAEIAARVSEGKPWDQAQAEFEEEEEKKMAAGASAL